MLLEQTIGANGELHTKMDVSIRRLKTFEPPEGYYLAFSGGKDSQCIYHLAKMAGVKFRAVYRVTSVDPPELIYFIREHYPDVIFDVPHDANGKRISMWSLIAESKIPPTRMARYCCAQLKETAGVGEVTVTGVRWAESARRKMNHGVADISGKPKSTQKKAMDMHVNYAIAKSGALIMNDDNDESRRLVEQCFRTQKTMLNPIVDWTDDEVWEFLNEIAKVQHCRLYEEGFKRLGCIGCPLAGYKNRKREFKRYPKYRALYVRAFDRMLERCRENGVLRHNWETGEDVMQWWLRDMPQKEG